MTMNDRLEAFLRANPGVWLDGHRLAAVAGYAAFRTRVSDLRLQRGLRIENRVRRFPDYTVTEYRYVPAVDLSLPQAGGSMSTSHVPSGAGYARTDNLQNELRQLAEHLGNLSDEALDAGDDIQSGQHAHEANCVAFAAAELRKTCATCKHGTLIPTTKLHGADTGIETPEFTLCAVWEIATPADGSGFCYRHDPKP